eukprot:1560642-Amphidinium_carterae.1
MKVNLKKAVVLCNGAKAKKLGKKVWRTGRLPPLKVTTRDLGVDTQMMCALAPGEPLGKAPISGVRARSNLWSMEDLLEIRKSRRI